MRTILLAAGLAAATSLASSAPLAHAEDTWSEPHPGVRLLQRTTSNPNWRIHAAFVSLCADGLSIDARSPQSTRITPSAWGQAMGAQLAVNGDFYRTDRAVPTVYGDAVGVGIRWPAAQTGLAAEFADDWYYQRYGWIAFGPGWVEFSHSKWVKTHAAELGVSEGWSPTEVTTEIPDGTFALVSGFPELVVEGVALTEFPDRGDAAERHPRTAMGLTEDRATFLLVVVDGRSTASVGMTGAELAALMKELGAHTAFNLDGGGSSLMWLEGEGIVNTPSDGSPRPVANAWGVFTGGQGQQPSSCPMVATPDAGPDSISDGGPDAGAGDDEHPGGADLEGGGGCSIGRSDTPSSAPVLFALLAAALLVRPAARRRRRTVQPGAGISSVRTKFTD